MSPRAAIIANPTKLDINELEAAIPAIESRYGYGPSLILETTADDAGSSQVALAYDRGVDLIIAAGGDGTVRLVVEALAGTDVPCGIVAAGTGNLLARNLDLEQRDLPDALAVAFGGEDRKIDLAHADIERPDGSREEHVFAVIAGIGIDAGMIENTDDDLKKRIGWPAYIGGIVKWLAGSGAFRTRFRSGKGRTWGARASSIMVGNCGLLTGGLVLLPDAELDDGKLDMIIMRARGPVGWAQVAAGVLVRAIAKQVNRLKRPPRTRALSYFQDTDFTFRVDSRPETFQLDGDTEGELVAAHIRAMPGALTVRVPRD